MKNLLLLPVVCLLLQGVLAAQDKKASRDDPIGAGEEVFISVKSTVIREGSTMDATIVARVKEGEKVKVVQDKIGAKGGWTKVEYGGKTGFVTRSAIVKREFFIPSETAAQTKDVEHMKSVGAAKGFNPQVEADYSKKENLGTQFALLDNEVLARPAYKNDQGDLGRRVADFMREGGLSK